MTAPSYFIAGCGRFGSQAARRLLDGNPSSKIIIADRDEKALREIFSFPVEVVPGDSVHGLDQLLRKGQGFDYVVPAVPFHFAFEFILSRLKPLGARRHAVPPVSGLPNPIRGETGDLYTSLADFLCPEDCPEPASYCTVTGRARRKPLYKRLLELRGPFESKVIRSHQLGLGVGGFRLRALLDLLEEVRKRRPSDPFFLITTACRCHGVTSALSFVHVN